MKICIVTGTRADFGLLCGLAKGIDASPEMKLQLIITGTHQVAEFGNTIDFIHHSGFSPDWTVEEITRADTDEAVARQVGNGILGFTEALKSLAPDVIVLLGDRYEMLAAAVASFFLKIPIVHLHGGEVTHGSFDDSIRHAITKLATVHCVSHETYARRVIQLGEDPSAVHVVGSLGLEALNSARLKSRPELERELQMQIKSTLLLVTYHPVTSGVRENQSGIKSLLDALERFPEATVVFTMPGGDPEYAMIVEVIQKRISRKKGLWHFVPSLGQQNYWSLMAISAAVVGNSSSGVLEAPGLRVPTVNIGPRQSGRIMGPSILSVGANVQEITSALETALSQDFRNSLASIADTFVLKGVTATTMSLIKEASLSDRNSKMFFDLRAE